MKLLWTNLFLFVCLSYCVGQDWKQLEAKTQKKSIYSSAGTVCLLDSTGVEVRDNGSGSFYIRKIIQIKSQGDALNYRVLKYDYDPLTAFAAFRDVTIYKTDGSKRQLNLSAAVDYVAPARSIYWGARQIMIEIGKLEKGDVIDYSIDKKGFTYALLTDGEATSDEDRFVPPMKGEYYDIVPFWVTEPTVRKVYTVSLPKDKPVQFEFYQGECATSVRNDGDRRVYSFTTSHQTPFIKEGNMVDLFDVAPKLMFSTTPNWKEKSLWFHKVNEDYGSFEATPEAQKKVDELTKGCKSEMEKISVITHWVADNMRYSGISMGKGEGYTLHNTKMNFTDRCGVCKDKAGLAISMLRMAGLEAYPAMTMSTSRIESIPADHFNHCVAVVKLSNGTYMPIDPTWVPFLRELWSSAEQQQNYLPGIPEGSDLLITPVSSPENHYFRINATSTITADGTLKGQLVVSAEGQSDKSVRNIFTSGFQSEWRNGVERELLAISPTARLLSVDFGKEPQNYIKAPIKITFRYEIPDYALCGSEEILFKPVTMSGLYSSVRSYLRINTELEERTYAFKDACSRLVELDEEIIIPKGFKLIQPAMDKNLQGQAADFTGTLNQQGNRIVMHQRLALKKRVYQAADWQNFRAAVNAHKSFGQDYLILKK
ncbi:MAG: DUF3857 domain-containing protein [Bacteroidales bacterium]|nr:DUF3857 domain-containing protein [Bacteroidales bacterium]